MSEIAWHFAPGLIEDALDRLLRVPAARGAAGHDLGERDGESERDGELAQARLRTAMRYAVFSGGKRLRSLLVLEAASVVSGQDSLVERALPSACALELVHAYSLVHDDLPAMDNADTRRGRASCHRAFGEATAILVGDALLTLAFETVAAGSRETDSREAGPGAGVPPATALRVVQLIARAAGEAGMVGGQAVDISWSSESVTEISGRQLLGMHALKTGALIRAATEAGALCGGGSTAQITALARYGEHLGRAFQIHDDVLDVEGDPRLTGKGSTDAANAKTTAPAVFGVAESKRLARQASEAAVAALREFGSRADALRQVAHFVVERAR